MASYQNREKVLIDWARTRCEQISQFKINRGRSGHFALGDFFVPIERSNTIVLLAHATGNDRFFPLIALIQDLISDGHMVVTFDLDGHGRNSTSLFGEGDPFTMIDAALERVVEQLGNHPIYFCGQSLGASLGLEFAGRSPGVFSRLALVGWPIKPNMNATFLAHEAATFIKPSFWRERRRYGRGGLIPAIGKFRRRLFPVRLPPNLAENGYLAMAKRTILSVDVEQVLNNIDVPSLALVGGQDYLARPELVAAALEGHDNWSIKEIDYANHYEMLFCNESNQYVRNWFREEFDPKKPG